MRGFWFYLFLGLVTSTLSIRGLPSGPMAWLVVGTVNGLATLLWFVMARELNDGETTRYALIYRLAVSTPLTFAVGLFGGLWLFAR